MPPVSPIWIIEPSPLQRARLALALSEQSGFSCSAHMEDIEALLTHLRRPAVQLPVALVLNVPKVDEISRASIRSKLPNTRFVMRIAANEAGLLRRALAAPVHAIADITDSATELARALRFTESGGLYLTPHIKNILHFDPKYSDQKSYGLTMREIEVLVHLSEGLQHKEIAKTMNISLATVASHVQRIYTKMHVCTAAGATARAIREGLI